MAEERDEQAPASQEAEEPKDPMGTEQQLVENKEPAGSEGVVRSIIGVQADTADVLTSIRDSDAGQAVVKGAEAAGDAVLDVAKWTGRGALATIEYVAMPFMGVGHAVVNLAKGHGWSSFGKAIKQAWELETPEFKYVTGVDPDKQDSPWSTFSAHALNTGVALGIDLATFNVPNIVRKLGLKSVEAIKYLHKHYQPTLVRNTVTGEQTLVTAPKKMVHPRDGWIRLNNQLKALSRVDGRTEVESFAKLVDAFLSGDSKVDKARIMADLREAAQHIRSDDIVRMIGAEFRVINENIEATLKTFAHADDITPNHPSYQVLQDLMESRLQFDAMLEGIGEGAGTTLAMVKSVKNADDLPNFSDVRKRYNWRMTDQEFLRMAHAYTLSGQPLTGFFKRIQTPGGLDMLREWVIGSALGPMTLALAGTSTETMLLSQPLILGWAAIRQKIKGGAGYLFHERYRTMFHDPSVLWNEAWWNARGYLAGNIAQIRLATSFMYNTASSGLRAAVYSMNASDDGRRMLRTLQSQEDRLGGTGVAINTQHMKPAFQVPGLSHLINGMGAMQRGIPNALRFYDGTARFKSEIMFAHRAYGRHKNDHSLLFDDKGKPLSVHKALEVIRQNPNRFKLVDERTGKSVNYIQGAINFSNHAMLAKKIDGDKLISHPGMRWVFDPFISVGLRSLESLVESPFLLNKLSPRYWRMRKGLEGVHPRAMEIHHAKVDLMMATFGIGAGMSRMGIVTGYETGNPIYDDARAGVDGKPGSIWIGGRQFPLEMFGTPGQMLAFGATMDANSQWLPVKEAANLKGEVSEWFLDLLMDTEDYTDKALSSFWQTSRGALFFSTMNKFYKFLDEAQDPTTEGDWGKKFMAELTTELIPLRRYMGDLKSFSKPFQEKTPHIAGKTVPDRWGHAFQIRLRQRGIYDMNHNLERALGPEISEAIGLTKLNTSFPESLPVRIGWPGNLMPDRSLWANKHVPFALSGLPKHVQQDAALKQRWMDVVKEFHLTEIDNTNVGMTAMGQIGPNIGIAEEMILLYVRGNKVINPDTGLHFMDDLHHFINTEYYQSLPYASHESDVADEAGSLLTEPGNIFPEGSIRSSRRTTDKLMTRKTAILAQLQYWNLQTIQYEEWGVPEVIARILERGVALTGAETERITDEGSLVEEAPEVKAPTITGGQQ